jgi:hypothetical protein
MVLPALTTVAPCAGTEAPVTVNASLSGSLSLVSTVTVTAVLVEVAAESSLATGAPLTCVTVIDTVAVAVPPLPSLMSYVNESGPE